MNIIFQIEGGLGKNIMATALCAAFKKKYPKDKLIVISAYPDVFTNNPHVDKVYNFGEGMNFYQKYIENKEAKIYIQDPYHHNNFQTSKQHLFKTWFEMFDLVYDGEMPEMYINKLEREHYGQFYKLDKPIMVLHTNGGPPNTGVAYNWARDMPESLVFQLIEKYRNDYAIVQIRRADQLMYPDVMSALDGYRSIAVLLMNSKKRLLIDSFSQHLCAALNLPSTVLWSTTTPEIFGYDLHTNIKANPFTLTPNIDRAMFQPFSLNEPLTSFPYKDTKEVFNFNKIVESLR